MADRDELRERIARLQYEFLHRPGKELAWEKVKDVERLAALVDVYYQRADAVLDALGLEQVGVAVLDVMGAPVALDFGGWDGEPVYRLAPRSES